MRIELNDGYIKFRDFISPEEQKAITQVAEMLDRAEGGMLFEYDNTYIQPDQIARFLRELSEKGGKK